jgi:hypothetical protein
MKASDFDQQFDAGEDVTVGTAHLSNQNSQENVGHTHPIRFPLIAQEHRFEPSCEDTNTA